MTNYMQKIDKSYLIPISREEGTLEIVSIETLKHQYAYHELTIDELESIIANSKKS